MLPMCRYVGTSQAGKSESDRFLSTSKSDRPNHPLAHISASRREAPSQTAVLNPHDSDFRGTRILAIDDSDDYLALLSVDLRSEGYEVETATSGTAGLELLAQGNFDCVLVDR